MDGAMWRAKVMTGKATAPPPSDVIPPTVAPTTMVKERAYRSGNKAKKLFLIARHHQINCNKNYSDVRSNSVT